ncbi:unnamed protein product [Sympodiomycopsis kandeliae]
MPQSYQPLRLAQDDEHVIQDAILVYNSRTSTRVFTPKDSNHAQETVLVSKCRTLSHVFTPKTAKKSSNPSKAEWVDIDDDDDEETVSKSTWKKAFPSPVKSDWMTYLTLATLIIVVIEWIIFFFYLAQMKVEPKLRSEKDLMFTQFRLLIRTTALVSEEVSEHLLTWALLKQIWSRTFSSSHQTPQ